MKRKLLLEFEIESFPNENDVSIAGRVSFVFGRMCGASKALFQDDQRLFLTSIEVIKEINEEGNNSRPKE